MHDEGGILERRVLAYLEYEFRTGFCFSPSNLVFMVHAPGLENDV